jgi:hypothetical protein
MDRFLARTKRPADAQALIGTISKSPAPERNEKGYWRRWELSTKGRTLRHSDHSNAAFLSGGQAYRALE